MLIAKGPRVIAPDACLVGLQLGGQLDSLVVVGDVAEGGQLVAALQEQALATDRGGDDWRVVVPAVDDLAFDAAPETKRGQHGDVFAKLL